MGKLGDQFDHLKRNLNITREFPKDPITLSIMDNPNYYRVKHLEYLAKWLHKVECGQIDRMIIAAPPRHSKSELCSLYWPCTLIGNMPWLKVGIASYNSDFAASWTRRQRDVLREFKPEILDPNFQQAGQYGTIDPETQRRGSVVSAGIGTSLTGRGINIMLLDDPVKDMEQALSPVISKRNTEWFNSVLSTRLEPWIDSDGVERPPAIVAIGTLWSKNDLLNTLIEEQDDYKVIKLPALAKEDDVLGRKPGEALWPKRFSKEVLEKKRKEHGKFIFASLYQCESIVYGGAVLTDNALVQGRYKPDDITMTAMTVDPAISESGDNTAIAIGSLTMDNRFYIQEIVERKMDFETQKQVISALYQQYNPQMIVIEGISYQRVLGQSLINDYNIPVKIIKSRGNKQVRLMNLIPYADNKKFVFNPNIHSWEQFEKEWLSWTPESKNAEDDGLDALETLVSECLLRGGNPYTTSDYVYDFSTAAKKRKTQRPAMHPYSQSYTSEGVRRPR